MKHKKNENEKTVVDSVLKVSKCFGFFWRNNTGAMPTPSGGFIRFGYPGSSDIIGVINGKIVCIECKRSKAKQSKSQIKFEKLINNNKGIYILVKGLKDMEMVYKRLMEIKDEIRKQ